MRDSMYSALYGAMSNEFRVDQISNNLANVNTSGYKRDRLTFHDTFIRYAHDYLIDSKPYLRDKDIWPRANVMARPRLSDQYVDTTQGSLEATGNPLDLGISGEGFFKVRAPEGDFMTRNGRFIRQADGTIVTPEGYPLLGAGGPLVIPETARDVAIDASGMIRADGIEIGLIDLVSVTDPMALEKIGKNLYQLQDGGVGEEIPAVDSEINQGFLEKSNVEVVTEMVKLIDAQRSFQVYQKMMQTTTELDKKAIDSVGKTL